MKQPHSDKGFTLIEVMVTLTVLAILAALAAPNLRDVIKSNEISAQSNELIAMIHLARNEAIRRNPTGSEYVTLELEAQSPGWAGYVRPPGGADTAEGCPEGAIRCGRFESSSFASEVSTIRFDSRGYSVDASDGLLPVSISLIHKDCTRTSHAKTISITATGQVSIEERECGSA